LPGEWQPETRTAPGIEGGLPLLPLFL